MNWLAIGAFAVVVIIIIALIAVSGSFRGTLQ